MRLLLGDNGEKLKSIGPSGAAKVAGWRGEDVPGAGDEVGLHSIIFLPIIFTLMHRCLELQLKIGQKR